MECHKGFQRCSIGFWLRFLGFAFGFVCFTSSCGWYFVHKPSPACLRVMTSRSWWNFEKKPWLAVVRMRTCGFWGDNIHQHKELNWDFQFVNFCHFFFGFSLGALSHHLWSSVRRWGMSQIARPRTVCNHEFATFWWDLNMLSSWTD